MKDKINDLENRSTRNNVRIVGLPESFKQQMFLEVCQTDISKALGLKHTCTGEHAHRIGQPQPGRKTSRPVIVKYLNYTNNMAVLKSARTEGLVYKGNPLLVFADSSA